MSIKTPCCSVENLLRFLRDKPLTHHVITDGSMIIIINPETGSHETINAQNKYYEMEEK